MHWRSGAALAVMVCASSLQAQGQDLWRSFQFDNLSAKTNVAVLERSQIAAIRRTLLARVQEDGWYEAEDGQAWLRGLTFDEVPLKRNVRVVRATAGEGCARSGQGANGGMWLFEINGSKVHFIGALGGWGMAVQPTEANGFRDFVIGFRAGGTETGLTFYRFDGKGYKQIAKASEVQDDDGTWRLVRDGQTSTKN
jgi:hypothetical protein